MRDLVRIADEDLQELTAPQRLRVYTAVAMALACTVFSLQGLLTLLTDAHVAALPGMDQLAGQIAWATGIIAMLVAVTFLVRGVVKRRLQWAIALSLLIHLLLCLSMSVVNLSGMLPAQAEAADLPGRPLEELTLPDYAGAENSDPDSAWRQPVMTETPESNTELERPEMKIAEAEKPQPVESTQPQDVEKLDTPERQEQIRMAGEARAEMERQASDNELPAPQDAEAPRVTTADSAAPELEAQVEQARRSSEAPAAERQQTDIASADPKVEAAKLEARRAEAAVTAENIPAEVSERSAAEIQAADAGGDNVQVTTLATLQMKILEQAIQIARQQSAAASGSSGGPALSGAATAVESPGVSSVRPDRAAGVGEAVDAVPASGGPVSMARNDARTASARDSGAESVEVTSAAGVGAPAVSESSASQAGGRGTAATVPAGSPTSGGPTASIASPSGGRVGSVSVVRSAAGGSSPQLGEPGGQRMTPGRGEGRQISAVGTSVGEVGVASVATRSAPTVGSVVASPGSLAPGRSNNTFPSGANANGSLSGPTGTASSTAGQSGPSRLSGESAVGGRGTEPSARLNADAGFARGTQPGVSMARAASAPGIPAGAAEAEQSGTLVFAGPQAASTGVSGLSGPRMSSVPRRSAGLPGSSSPAGTAAPATAGAASPGRVAVGSPRSGAGNDRPKLASSGAIAGLIKKTLPGIAGTPADRIADSLSLRTTDARREAAKTLGGSEASEGAVERGLAWLARNQYPDGHWSIDDFPGDETPDPGHGSFQSNSAATGLALLAFLGAGYTHQSGDYQDVVDRGMQWLLDRQKPNGDLFADETEFVWFYSHGIAAISLCEAYGMTKDARLKEPAQNALNFIVESQHPEFGGWRYRPRFESDTSVSGWQLMALKSGEMAGLTVPKEAYAGVARWLDTVRSKSSAGQFSYHPSRDASPTMTAEGLLMRQYLGAGRDDAELIAGAGFLRTRLPDFGQRDAYYWYYATQVMFHMQGDYWNDWNSSLRDTLVNTQSKEGSSSGSWDPARPTPEKWANAGGRHYLTCLNLLMLEVYYRHLPLYLELEK